MGPRPESVVHFSQGLLALMLVQTILVKPTMFTGVTIFESIPPLAFENLDHSFSDDERPIER